MIMIKLKTLEGVLLMQKCPVCSHMNRPGELICEKCGANLQTAVPVVNMDSSQPKGVAPVKAEEKAPQPAKPATPSSPEQPEHAQPSSSDAPTAKSEQASPTEPKTETPQSVGTSLPSQPKADEEKPSSPQPTEAKSEAKAPESPVETTKAEAEPKDAKADVPPAPVVKAETTTKRMVPGDLEPEKIEPAKAEPPSGKIECPNCHHLNRQGEIFCESCGANLKTGQKAASTKSLPDEERKQYDVPLEESVPDRGSDIFPTGGALRLQIEGSPEPILLPFHQQEIVLGRRDPATGALPDVDLTPFAGYRMGVSRRHSQIRRSHDGHLELFDLGSSNGTFLNGQRLEAHYPYRLRDGDKIALGQISILVHFEKSMSSQRQL